MVKQGKFCSMKCALYIIMLSLFCAVVMSGCGRGGGVQFTVDNAVSSIYTDDDLREAADIVIMKISSWKGFELHSITYAGDEKCSKSNVDWLNEVDRNNGGDGTFTQCVLFRTNFHSPKEDSGAWEPDNEYTGWQWWLAREGGGRWKLITWGF